MILKPRKMAGLPSITVTRAGLPSGENYKILQGRRVPE
jgi:hypothetical protein